MDGGVQKQIDLFRAYGVPELVHDHWHDPGPVLFVFQGFPGEFYRQLAANGLPHLLHPDMHRRTLNPQGYIDVRKLQALQKHFEVAFLGRRRGINWCFYEELILI